MTLTYQISQVAPYINWVYFYHAWGISGRPDAEKEKLRQEAEEALRQIEGKYQAFALFELFVIDMFLGINKEVKNIKLRRRKKIAEYPVYRNAYRYEKAEVERQTYGYRKHYNLADFGLFCLNDIALVLAYAHKKCRKRGN